jgi:hypothetical protein
MVQKISTPIRVLFVALTYLIPACGGAPFSAADPPVADGGDPPGEGGPSPRPDSGAIDSGAAPDAMNDSSADPPIDSATIDSGATTVDSALAPMCTTPTSPALGGTQGVAGAGIQFHVTKDTVLTSFKFTASGQNPDTVTLSDTNCNAISSASVPNEPLPGYAPYVVNVSWPLKAGTSYMLTNAANSFNQTAHSSSSENITFPYASGILVVEEGLVQCPLMGLDGQVWTAFTDLTFCDGNGS